MRSRLRFLASFTIVGVAALLLCSCNIPRVMVMDDPLSPGEHLQLGMSYELDGEMELAEKEYVEASEELPMAHYLLGNLYFTQERYDKAEKSYKKAVDGMPHDPRPRNNLAWLYYIRGEKLKEAKELAAEAVRFAPSDEKAAYIDTLDKIQAALDADL